MEKNKKKSKGAVYILWTIIAVVILGIVLISANIKSRKANAVEEEAPPEDAVAVKVITMHPRSVENKVLLPGKVVPFAEVDIKAERPGRITELNVDQGDKVKKGQLLMRLDESAWIVNRDQSLIEKREAAKDVKRWEELKKTGAVSERDHDGVIARRDIAEVSYRRAQVDLEKCEVRTPVDGVVDIRFFDLGEYAMEGMPAFKVVNLDKAKIVINVPERDVNSVHVGSKMSFRVSSVPGKAYQGEITFVSTLADKHSNSFRVELVVDNKEGLLKGGMIAEVELMRGSEKDVMILSLATVIPRKGEHIVFLINEDRAIRRTVKIGSFVGDEVVISGGLAEGDKVVVEGHRALQDGGLIVVAGE